MSEPKRPGETAFRYPGVLFPSHPSEDDLLEQDEDRHRGRRPMTMAY